MSEEETAVALDEQEATNAWQEATPTVVTINSRPMNLRRKSGMVMDSLDNS